MRIAEIEALHEEELFEAVIPATKYGYWLTPEGVFHVVGYQAHTTALRSLIGKRQGPATLDANDGFDQHGLPMLKAAFNLGWVRIGSNVSDAPNMLFVHVVAGSLTARSFSGLRQLAGTQDFTRYYLTVINPGSKNLEFVFADGVNDRGQFMLALGEHGRKKIAA